MNDQYVIESLAAILARLASLEAVVKELVSEVKG